MGKKVILVDKWKPTKADKKVLYDGKLIIIPFDKIFERENLSTLNTFIIKKESYVNKFPELTHYINYFIKYYDKDNELLMAYLKLKFLIDNKKNHISLSAYIKSVYTILLTDTMQEKIKQMVEDNYYIDLSSKTDIKYNESLEFTVDHAKVMMQISMSMKLMMPVLFHYLNTYNLMKERKYIFRFYEGLFDMYGDDIDIYNKLWISCWSKVNVNYIRNKVIWEQREVFGVEPLTKMKEFLNDKIISETMFRYSFDKNIISFNYVILDKQLGYFLIEQYKENRIELSGKKDALGLSGLDKLEMNASKLDESMVILSEVNIKKTIKRLEKKIGTKVSKEEIEYYRENMSITKFQTQLVFYYYAKYFYGYQNLNMINRTQYFKLLILMKKRLQYQGFVYLPQILTANIESRLNTRTIQNSKFLSKIETSSIYQSIITDKYDTLEDINKGTLIMNILSTILNTTFSLVDYNMPEKLGENIEINQDVVSDEFLNYLNQL